VYSADVVVTDAVCAGAGCAGRPVVAGGGDSSVARRSATRRWSYYRWSVILKTASIAYRKLGAHPRVKVKRRVLQFLTADLYETDVDGVDREQLALKAGSTSRFEWLRLESEVLAVSLLRAIFRGSPFVSRPLTTMVLIGP